MLDPSLVPFVEFPKLPRLKRECIVTEKLDGTNAQVYIDENLDMLAGSRSRWITPEADNYGFAKWVKEHRDELLQLGPGNHFGEWWGCGIQRGYEKEKRFSLFNVERWCLHGAVPQLIPTSDPRVVKTQIELPPCAGLVPLLWRGIFDTLAIEETLKSLSLNGSAASPGFTNPEGIVVYHIAGRVGFKAILRGDDEWKGKAN